MLFLLFLYERGLQFVRVLYKVKKSCYLVTAPIPLYRFSSNSTWEVFIESYPVIPIVSHADP
jgi:hypothetical protein